MSNRALEARLKFMEFDDNQREVLRSARALIEKNIGPALDRFYARAKVTPETARFFSDNEHMQSARAAQMKHWMKIVEARYDDDYLQSVRRIGAVHARIGLEPQWYIGSYALIMEEIIEAVYRDTTAFKRLSGAPCRAKLTGALMKAALLDMDLSISIYFEVAATERNNAIQKLDDALARLARGDLAEDITGMPPAFQTLEGSYNKTMMNLRGTIGSVVQASEIFQTNSQNIATVSNDLARKMEGNAAALEETAAALVQIEERVKASAMGAKETLAIADEALTAMQLGKEGASIATESMNSVHESAQGIDEVIEGVDKIAFQTRVLAMNAAIEAGRAGEAGRGFAVVAQLVNNLAMRAEEEAQKARLGLTTTQSDIVAAVEAVSRVNEALEGVSNKYERVHALIAQMTDDNHAQSLGLTEINSAVGAMDNATQQNAILIDNTSQSAQSLAEDAVKLAEHASRFQLSNAA